VASGTVNMLFGKGQVCNLMVMGIERRMNCSGGKTTAVSDGVKWDGSKEANGAL